MSLDHMRRRRRRRGEPLAASRKGPDAASLSTETSHSTTRHAAHARVPDTETEPGQRTHIGRQGTGAGASASRSFAYPRPAPPKSGEPPGRASQSPPQITPGARGRGPHPVPGHNPITNQQIHTPPRQPPRGQPASHRRTNGPAAGENGRDPLRPAGRGRGGGGGNGGRLLVLRVTFRAAAAVVIQAGAPAQPSGRPPPPPPHPHPDPDHRDPRHRLLGVPRAGRRRGQPARRLPLLPHPLAGAAAAAEETAGPPRRLRGAEGRRQGGGGGGRGGGGGAAAGGVRGAAVPAVRGAAPVARRRAGVAVQALPPLRPLLRAQLVQRQGGRLRALGPPPRRPPRLLLLLPRHGLRHPRPGAAPPRRPRLPPLPREQPPDPRARRHRRRRHLPRHVHLRTQDDPDPVPDEPRAAADRPELRRFLRRFREEGRVVVGQADRRREAEVVNGIARLVN